jgi:ABC-type dipeptide/oligopeptide/nickel transport system permease component
LRACSFAEVLKLITGKLIQGVLMILIVSAVTFALLGAAGGDALTSLRDNPQISEATIENLRRVYGFDQPLPVRFAKWFAGALIGDLGESISFRVPVGGLIATRLLNTLYLSAAALAFALFISLTLSFLAARSPGKTIRIVIEALVLLTASTPRIVLALLVLMATAMMAGSAIAVGSGSLFSFTLTAIVLASPLIAIFLAQAHEQLTAAMNEDFVSLARAKGLSEGVLIMRHASRAALGPLLTLFGLSLGGLLGGSVIVETILGWPGIGSLMVSAVRTRDVPLVMGIVLVASVAVWLGNTLAEVLQVVNDDRLRSGENK